jgi:hypothetical protein
MPAKAVRYIADIPKGSHWAVLISDYRDSYRVLDYMAFDSQEELEKWIEEQYKKGDGKKNFQVIQSVPYTVSIAIGLDVASASK